MDEHWTCFQNLSVIITLLSATHEFRQSNIFSLCTFLGADNNIKFAGCIHIITNCWINTITYSMFRFSLYFEGYCDSLKVYFYSKRETSLLKRSMASKISVCLNFLIWAVPFSFLMTSPFAILWWQKREGAKNSFFLVLLLHITVVLSFGVAFMYVSSMSQEFFGSFVAVVNGFCRLRFVGTTVSLSLFSPPVVFLILLLIFFLSCGWHCWHFHLL